MKMYKCTECNTRIFVEDKTIPYMCCVCGKPLAKTINASKMYDISIMADDYATIQKELTESEYILIKNIAMELDEEGSGYQGTLEIKESK